MSFCFNFELSDGDDSTNAASVSESVTTVTDNQDKKGLKTSAVRAFEVKSFYDDSLISKLEMRTVALTSEQLRIVDTSKLEQIISLDEAFQSSGDGGCSPLKEIVEHSDLVTGVYEGGLKVWECGVDLANYLASGADNSIEISAKTVLELGCGAGLPGLFCIKCGAARVDFQDYNVEVLKLLTHTNVNCNLTESDLPSKTVCRYFAGDWGSFCDLIEHRKRYDLILSAETIYNEDNYSNLHTIFDKLLSDSGTVLVAAKVYYFGVGGSIDAFLDFVTKRNVFASETVWETQSGVPRKILKLKRKTQTTKTELQKT